MLSNTPGPGAPHEDPQPEPTPLDSVVDAVYQDGVIKPLRPLDLPAGTPIQLRIATRHSVVINERAGFNNIATTDISTPGRSTPNGTPAEAARELLATLRAAYHQRVDTALHQPWRPITALLAASLTVFVLYALWLYPPEASYGGVFALWLAAGALYCAAVAPSSFFHPASCIPKARVLLRLRVEQHWPAILALGAIMLLALGLRVWSLDGIPPTLGGDEGSQGLEAIKVLTGEIRNPFSTGWLGVPTMSFFFNAPSIALLGNTATALRLPWALVGTLTVLCSFFLVKRLAGMALGLTTALLLATYHYHIHFSRLGSNQVADAFFVALALLLLYRAYDRRSLLDWALCGVVVGAAQYFYAGARFTAVVVAVVILFLLLRDRSRFLRENGWGVLVLLGAALLVGAPMIQYAVRFPQEYNARVNEVGIFQSGWLAREQEIRSQGALPILFDQLKRAALAFNVYPDRTLWYGSPRPLFDTGAGALFLLGLGYASVRLADRRLFPMVAWWWGAVILGGMLTESPPSSQRLITLAPPAVFFVALALVRVGQLVLRSWGAPRYQRLLAIYLTAAALVLSIGSIRWYFVEYTPMRIYGNFSGVVATELATYARDKLGDEARIYFFGPPRMYIRFGSIPYLAPEVEGVDIEQPLQGPPGRELVLPDKDATFVFLPEREGELNLIRRTFPGGTLDRLLSPIDYSPLAFLYHVPREQLAAR
jgi:predicted DNA-binding antitoxin AbrB/MazE fold protein/4-amino-4-deoxy-L-arabinose transferase-like glycosyltransferase